MGKNNNKSKRKVRSAAALGIICASCWFYNSEICGKSQECQIAKKTPDIEAPSRSGLASLPAPIDEASLTGSISTSTIDVE